ncbi:MAG: DNA/RNA non-specific endonuclease [Pseudoflavonifractor sp.]|nr:DNA/RNA non-specific endonuclease [Alloprevotella sp.]MCM1117496.1 DNA/RNA non-specific endonuclease [Pseudoflavonifractor sp.]
MNRQKKKSRGLLGLKSVQLLAIVAIIIFISYMGSRSEASHSPSSNAPFTDASELMTVIEPHDLPSTPVDYKGFSMSFNPKMHIPNWVAWELAADETNGSVPRYKSFVEDPSVAGCAELYDYSYSGYDRGHMAPAADMKWDSQAMKESFMLTNMCPQAKELNTGAWRTLEERCRLWARRDSAIIIIAGPVLNPPPHEYIGDNRVAVPKSFFKVVLAPYARPMRAIAFIMPNGYVQGGMQRAVTTVDEVERITSLDFFASLPDSIENAIEATSDFNLWNAKTSRK